MNTLLRVEARKTAPVLCGMGALILVLGIIRLIWSQNATLDFAYLMAVMMAWTGLAGYEFGIIYTYFVSGKDFLMHLGDAGPHRVCLRKGLVLTVWLWLFFLLGMVLDLSHLHASFAGAMGSVVAYYLVGRTVSLLTFTGIVLCAVGLGKFLRSKFLSLTASLLFVVAVSVLLAVLDWRIAHTSNAVQLFVGVSTGPSVLVHTYAGILPVSYGDPAATTVVLPWPSVAVNLVVLLLCLLGWALLARRRLDFYPR